MCEFNELTMSRVNGETLICHSSHTKKASDLKAFEPIDLGIFFSEVCVITDCYQVRWHGFWAFQ